MPRPDTPTIPIGATRGRWTVVAGPFRRGNLWYTCRCACGTIRSVRAFSLANGRSASCGCLHRERVTQASTRHGMHDSPEYSLWRAMLERCYNPKAREFKNYGGRGIAVCERWRQSFEAFIADVGRRPGAALSIDRRDNNGNYEPGNLRWATAEEQGLNRRATTRYQHAGESLTIRQWAERRGLKHATLRTRIKRLHWPVPIAIERPLQTH